MPRLAKVAIRNSVANIARLAVGGVVSLALPRILTHVLSQDRFAAWVLLLQIAAYATFLDFGVQVAVSRFVAQATERNDPGERDAYITTSVLLLSVAALIGFLIVAGVAWFVPHLFRQAPVGLLPEFRAGLLVLAALSALTLPTSAFTGAFMGLHRNQYPAIIGSATRLLGAAVVILAVYHSDSLVVMAAILGSFNLLGGLVQGWMLRRTLPAMKLSLHTVTRQYTRTVVRFCTGLSIMSVATFLVGGLDLTVLGHFDFDSVAYYAVAANLTLLIGGLAGAGASALLAPMSTIHARSEHARLGQAVVSSTRLVIQLLILLCFPIILFGRQIFMLWLGPAYAQRSTPIMDVLVIATVIRMIGTPYTSAVIAAGKQSRASLSAVVEGLTNLVASVIGVIYLGAIGVAWGTLLGTVVGVLLHIVYNMPSIRDVQIRPMTFLQKTTFEPALMLAPVVLGISAAVLLPSLAIAFRCLLALAGVAATGYLLRPEVSTWLNRAQES